MGTITIVNNFQLFDEFIASLCQDETSQITPANQIFFDGFVETISPLLARSGLFRYQFHQYWPLRPRRSARFAPLYVISPGTPNSDGLE